MTTVPGFLQLLLLYLWIVPGNQTLINAINYPPVTSADFAPPLPAFPNLGEEYGGYNVKSADSQSEAEQNMNGSVERRSPADLPEGYVPFSQHRAAYKIHEELATWNEARERCIAEGGYLAVIDSRDKVADIRSMNNQPKNWLHVGIYNSAESNQWVRVENGLAVTSLPWAYEDSQLTGSCAGISLFQLGLVHYLCSGKREHFVCEIPITGSDHLEESSIEAVGVENISYPLPPFVDITPTPPSPNATLPEGYITFSEDGVAYKIHPERMSWHDARDTCISEGARLAITDSQEKIIHIQSLPAYGPHVWLYVGIHMPENGDEWVRVDDGLPVPSSVPWAADFPDDVAGRRCAQISAFRNALVNYPCALSESFVCEITIFEDDNSEQSTIEVTITTPTAWSSTTETHTAHDLKVSNDYDNDEFTHGGANSTTSPPPSPPVPLPEGYIKFSEDRAAYKIYYEKESWYEARDTCISEGARLAITNSEEKIDHILSILPAYKRQMWFHVGIHKPENGDEWVRVDDGLPVLSSVQWWAGFPKNIAGDRCARVNIYRGPHVDNSCLLSEAFVCEIPISDDDDGKDDASIKSLNRLFVLS